MAVPFVDLSRQLEGISEEIYAAVRAVIEDTAFIGGMEVELFESEFASFQGVKHCVGVGNGTDAIEILLEALKLPRGSEVIVPANSFVATSEAVSRVGLSVVFADVEPGTYNLDATDVARRITSRTSAIIAVHLYGQPADTKELRRVADEADILLLEDAAQAHGAMIGRDRVGSAGVGATFSFYPGKNLGAFGDAGAVVCGDDELATRVRMVANHGRTSKYEHEFEGRNSRLDAIQAAVLRVKLRYLDEWNEQRRRLADRYRAGLDGVGDLVMPVEGQDVAHVYHLFVVRTGRRDELRRFLRENGIATGIHYPVALPRLEAYANHPQHDEPFVADRLSKEVLSLPMADSISAEQVDFVVAAVTRFFESESPGTGREAGSTD